MKLYTLHILLEVKNTLQVLDVLPYYPAKNNLPLYYRTLYL